MNLTYEDAKTVANFLDMTPTDHIETADVISALVNAMNRINALEQKVEKLQEDVMHGYRQPLP